MTNAFDLAKEDPLKVGNTSPSYDQELSLSYMFHWQAYSDLNPPATCPLPQAGNAAGPMKSAACQADLKHGAVLEAIAADPHKLVGEIEKDFNVFDRNGDGYISSDETNQVLHDPHTSAQDKLIAEVMQDIIFYGGSYHWGNEGRLSRADLQQIDAANNPQYLSARQQLKDKLSDKDTLVQSALDNFDALSDNGYITPKSVEKGNLNAEQRAIAESLGLDRSQHTDEWLTEDYQRVSGADRFGSDLSQWRFSKQDLQKILQIDRTIETGSTWQLSEEASIRAGQDWLNVQKEVWNAVKQGAVGDILGAGVANEVFGTLDLPLLTYYDYKDLRQQQEDVQAKPK